MGVVVAFGQAVLFFLKKKTINVYELFYLAY
jgi:hypothetical protein